MADEMVEVELPAQIEDNNNVEVVNVGHAIDVFQEKLNEAINTKEDYDVLNSLFLGTKLYEERETTRIVGLAKIFDML